MDYCHQCRRHLNGALACAGCGTPVEELRYETPQAAAPRPVAAPRVEYAEPAARVEYEEPTGHVYELDPIEPPRAGASGGRAAARRGAAAGRGGARRSRRARGRKGRNVLVGTLGIVLAAGALSMAKLALEPEDEGGAATAVQEEEVVETSLPPLPSDSATAPEGPTPISVTKSAAPKDSDAPAPGHTGIPGQGSGGQGSGGQGSGGQGSGGGSQGTGGGPQSGSPSASPSASVSQTGPTPTGSGTATPPPGPPAPTTPTPTPSPTRECWLFICW
ncbi:hypothetical protein AB0D99_25950 [Streptomyces sp. NPDC047971]|uniref:SCO2400 family protein n=1 Tax=Streptomyces sp. NPDC047971 TaxID=3154499 RepID=UPI00340EC3F5